MIDVNKCVEEFLNTDEVPIYEKGSVEPHRKFVNRTPNNMTVLTFNNGNGVAVIDTEQFNKLSKTKQNKFLKLCR